MSQDVVTVLDREIAELEQALQNNPTFRKLVLAKEMRALYAESPQQELAITSGRHTPVRARPRVSRNDGSTIKTAILAHVDGFFGNRSGPYKTTQIYESVERAGLQVPGKEPRNNLSAMLSNSDKFVSTSNGWVRAGSDLDPSVAEAADVAASAASNVRTDNPDNNGPDGAQPYYEGR